MLPSRCTSHAMRVLLALVNNVMLRCNFSILDANAVYKWEDSLASQKDPDDCARFSSSWYQSVCRFKTLRASVALSGNGAQSEIVRAWIAEKVSLAIAGRVVSRHVLEKEPTAYHLMAAFATARTIAVSSRILKQS